MKKILTGILTALLLVSGCAKESDSSTPAHPKENTPKAILPTPTHEPTLEEVSAAAQKIGIEMVDQTEIMNEEMSFDQVFACDAEKSFVLYEDWTTTADAEASFKNFYQQYIFPAETVEGIKVWKTESDVGNYALLDATSYQDDGAFFMMYRVNDKVVLFTTDVSHSEQARQFMDMIDG